MGNGLSQRSPRTAKCTEGSKGTTVFTDETDILLNNASLDPAAPEQDRCREQDLFNFFFLLERSSILLPQASSEALLK